MMLQSMPIWNLEALEKQWASKKPLDQENIKKKTHRKICKQYKLEDILVDARKAEEFFELPLYSFWHARYPERIGPGVCRNDQ